MAVRFILGRSGAGKTRLCLAAVQTELRQRPQGPPLVLLVPEQATFQVEQALLSPPGPTGYHRAVVVSFARLARLVLDQTGPPPLEVLTETGKQLLLRRLLQEQRPRLTIFAASALRTGFVAQLSALIRELRQYRHAPSDLADLAAAGHAGGDQPLLAKLADLALVYAQYEQAIAGRFLDPDDPLDLMSRRCSDAPVLRRARVWVDGFAGFTAQQTHALAAILPCAAEVYLSLCLDPWSATCTRVEAGEEPDPTDLFHPTLETYRHLRRLVAAAGLPVAEPLRLPAETPAAPGPAPQPRFAASPVLARLEQHFDQPDPGLGAPPQPPTDDRASLAEDQVPARGLVLVEAPTRRAEVEAAARQILRLCRCHAYRYREIAVILRDFTDYQELLEAIFAEHGIPYFLDQRRPIRRHPLVELIRSALAAVSDGFRQEDVIRYLKTDLAGPPRLVADVLENYALEHGVDGSRWLEDRPWRPGKWAATLPTADSTDHAPDTTLDQWRRQAILPLQEMRHRLLGPEPDPQTPLEARRITAELVRLLDDLHLAPTLQEWCEQERQAGHLDAAATHEQVYADVLRLLEEVVEALGHAQLTLPDYAEILDATLAQMTLALVPPALDQVLVGAIERSRHPRLRAALVLGFNEGRFPRLADPPALLTDDQREQLQRAGLELAPTTRQNFWHEYYLAYIALTRPSEFLWLSFAAADDQGTVLNPSSLLDRVRLAAGGAPLLRITDQPHGCLEAVATVSQLGRQLAAALAAAAPDEPLAGPMAELYHWAAGRRQWAEQLHQCLAGLTYANNPTLDPALARRLFGSPLRSTVSRLESFAACPFQHFARYLLRLEERPRLRLEAVDVGAYFHKALRRAFENLRHRGRTWADLTPAQADDLVQEVTRHLAQDDQFAALLDQSQRNRWLLRRADDHLKQLCRRLAAAQAAGRFRQAAAEVEFGLDKPLEELRIELDPDRTLLLHGVIDRYDLCRRENGALGAAVLDYKTGDTRFSFERFYHGLDLQLLTYLEAIVRAVPAGGPSPPQPAGALYVPIVAKGARQECLPPPDVLAAGSGDQTRPAKARGLLSRSWLNDWDAGVAPAAASSYYAFAFTKDGSLHRGRSADVVEPAQMQALLTHNRHKLAELARRVLEGDIAVAPYRLHDKTTPCPQCPFGPVCRFDYSVDSYRFLASLDQGEVLKRLAEQRA